MVKLKEDIKIKSIPLRSCIACRTRMKQSELLRIGYDSENMKMYLNRGNGRGVYLCKKDECINTAQKRKSISRALKISENDIDYTIIFEETKR